MPHPRTLIALALTGGLALTTMTTADEPVAPPKKDKATLVKEYQDYKQVVAKTAAMVSDAKARALAGKHGLNVLNVTWEDTGRFKGSSVGPNISDVTIQVQQMDPRTEKFSLTCMPVIRFPNFSDRSADLPMHRFYLRVGNQTKDGKPKLVSLTEYLDNIRAYLSKGDSWKGERRSLLAPRDSHVLVSAQACFLPVPKGGKATFNPVIFNYQSYEGDPAVLTILATREGTSATIIDNKRDGFQAGRTWGQRLFHNHHGQRASLTGQRLSDVAKGSDGKTAGSIDEGPSVKANALSGANMVLLIQVPLKQKNPRAHGMLGAAQGGGPPMENMRRMRDEKSDVEKAVIGHGKVEGKYTEIAELDIERDTRFPVRVTVQFYKATSNGVVNAADVAQIKKEIEAVYANADHVGSLVDSGDSGRPTEYEGPKFQPPGWWASFWATHQKNTGQTREQTIAMLQELFGPNWVRFAREGQKPLGAAIAHAKAKQDGAKK